MTNSPEEKAFRIQQDAAILAVHFQMSIEAEAGGKPMPERDDVVFDSADTVAVIRMKRP
jgi:hypothetical protein